MGIKEKIESGNTRIGIEFGSTRIKTVLIDDECNTVASGSYTWENQLVNGLWTYSLEEIWHGLQESYQAMTEDVQNRYSTVLTRTGAIGFSAMMHGYMAFDKEGELLVPFRTWRNTNTGKAAGILTDTFAFNIPLRWSISHLFQAVLDREEHVEKIDYITTLAGFIHWKLTGRKILGMDDASGMFPIDSRTKKFDQTRMAQFNQLVKETEQKPGMQQGEGTEQIGRVTQKKLNISWKLADILPEVLSAGEEAGVLSEEGAALLDVSGRLQAGIPVCPPEGDAGTGMVATNSVAKRTGNVSAGTSVFAMVVLEKELEAVHKEIDVVMTPTGEPVAMVHCNNCTSDINAWAELFREFAGQCGMKISTDQLYTTLFKAALAGDKDCGGLMGYNYYSGEPVTGFEQGIPMFLRAAASTFNLANFMRMQLCTSLGALKYGLDILRKEEKIAVDQMYGHGGFFKTPEVGQKIMSAAIDAPVTVMETAGEGGAWGMAVLASYMIDIRDMRDQKNHETLEEYLNNKVFINQHSTTVKADDADVKGFDEFMKNYRQCLSVEAAAVNAM